MTISPEARDFMERLMTLDPEKRLGYNGAEEVKKHPFFASINWETLLTESPSFVPQPADMEDTDYFDPRGATMDTGDGTEILDESSKAQVERAKAIIREQNPENIPPVTDKKENAEKSSDGDESNNTDFGTFMYKNIPVLEKANEDVIRKIRSDTISATASSDSSSGKLVGRVFPSKSTKGKGSLMEQSGQSTPTTAGAMNSPSTSSSVSVTPLSMSPSVSSKLCMVSPSHVNRRTPESTLPHIPTKMSGISSASSSREGTPLRSRSLSTPAIDPVKAAAAIAAIGNKSPTTNLKSTAPVPIPMQPEEAPQMSESSPGYLVTKSHFSSLGGKGDRRLSISSNGSSPRVREGHLSKMMKPLDCLVADDNPISCKILETILEMLHCRCVIVRNGAQAIRSAMSDVRYDIIFMDIRMPISKY